MSIKGIYGLGAHADVPVTHEEDEAFAALSQRAGISCETQVQPLAHDRPWSAPIKPGQRIPGPSSTP